MANGENKMLLYEKYPSDFVRQIYGDDFALSQESIFNVIRLVVMKCVARLYLWMRSLCVEYDDYCFKTSVVQLKRILSQHCVL